MSGKITTAILADLEAKARAATRGEWVTGQDGHLRGAVNCGKKHIAMANFFHSRDEEQRVLNTEDNADYIAAASPDVVLALVAEFHHVKLSRNLQWLEHLRLKKETSQRYLEMLDAAEFEARVAVKLAINTTRNSQPCPYGNSRTCTCECDSKHRRCIDNRLKLARLAVEQEMEKNNEN